jgi:serine/threonine-protein kinase RsbW
MTRRANKGTGSVTNTGVTAGIQRAITLTNHYDDLGRLRTFVEAFCADGGLEQRIIHELTLVLEELFSNVVKYGHDDEAAHEIHATLTLDEGKITLAFDDDGRAFNPLTVPDPDVGAVLENKRVGGWGLQLVRNLMNEAHYERRTERNYLTLTKSLAG